MDRASFFLNLVVALSGATIGALIAVRLGQSPVLGYILTGFVISPYTPGFVGDLATVESLAEIGVILLMFAIGVQLSFRDLMRVGPIAIGGAIVQVIIMIGVGYVAGLAFGWQPIEALFFGAVLSNSSSTVLGRVLGDRGETNSWHGQAALAWSTVQDFSTVVLIVILSSIATGGDEILGDLLWAVGRASLLLVLLVPLGLFVFPRLFERVASFRSREVFVLTVAIVALGTAFVASLFGLSLALGAFVAGIVVGESDLSHQILGEVMPLRDIFAGLFFVSVGMLVDPGFVFSNLGLVLVTVFLIIVVKGLLSAGIIRLAGYGLRPAILTGAALGQCAEFSFLMASVGNQIGAIGPTAYSLMLAGAVASIALASPLRSGIDRILPWIQTRVRPEVPAYKLERVASGEERPARHAVICGYGRVGRVLASALQRRQISYIVVEEDPRVARTLQQDGVPVVIGNAGNRYVLEQADLERTRVLILAIPDPLATQQAISIAREINPSIEIVARARSIAERMQLEELGASEAVVGELEVALELTRHTLRRFGVSALELQALLRGLRERITAEQA